MTDKGAEIKIGWAQASITPDRPIILGGFCHARVTDVVRDPVTATALVIEKANSETPGNCAVMVSCDLVTISDELRDAVRKRIQTDMSGLDPKCVFLCATHSHTAPDVRIGPYGMKATVAGAASQNASKYGSYPDCGWDIMCVAEYLDFAADRIAGAIKEAWAKRSPSGIAYGMGHAVVGRNRRLTYQDGTTTMYGDAGLPEFRHVEGYEEHFVYAMTTYDRANKLTGIIVNLPCPAQVTESIWAARRQTNNLPCWEISADFWHETREELRRRFGEDVFILAQCAPAGDISPHIFLDQPAEARMLFLKGFVESMPEKLNSNLGAPFALRKAIALRIADAVSDIVPAAARAVNWSPEFLHQAETIELPRRIISEKDIEEALAEARPYKEQYEQLLKTTNDPEFRKQPHWWVAFTKAYGKMKWGERVRERFELQQNQPTISVELHSVRLGEIVFATNPFELYVDYATRIRARSKATQTFLVQLAGGGMYLPSARSIEHKGYGSNPASTLVGPEGGDQLVEWTVKTINRMYAVS